MNGNAAMEDDRRVLKHIVALLYAFAGMAERLCARSRPVRCLVLWILRSAEPIARDFVMDMALDQGAKAPACLIPALHGGDSPADAMRLAQSFRALAVLLQRLAAANPGCSKARISGICIKLTACAAAGQLLAGASYGQSQLCLALPAFTLRQLISRCPGELA